MKRDNEVTFEWVGNELWISQENHEEPHDECVMLKPTDIARLREVLQTGESDPPKSYYDWLRRQNAA